MTFFTFICNFVGLVSNICVLFLTVYTLYLTAFSRKMHFISMGHSMSAFFGEYYKESSKVSLRDVAAEFDITLLKVRKVLITAGVYATDISE